MRQYFRVATVARMFDVPAVEIDRAVADGTLGTEQISANGSDTVEPMLLGWQVAGFLRARGVENQLADREPARLVDVDLDRHLLSTGDRASRDLERDETLANAARQLGHETQDLVASIRNRDEVHRAEPSDAEVLARVASDLGHDVAELETYARRIGRWRYA